MGHKVKVLVTGAAGFIGYHLSERLLSDGYQVVGFDNLNDYYDVRLKEARLERLKAQEGFSFVRASLEDRRAVEACFEQNTFDYVANLAAQAGVRYSLTNPHVYIQSNVDGFLNILEACRHSKPKHLLYASSSSVYGANTSMPFSVHDNVDHPLSLYAATKKANELMAHTYSHLYQLPTTGLRFFTVYGPWGRPDMALFKFTHAILAGQPIDVYNHGHMQRDFTYVADIVEGVFRVMKNGAKPNKQWDSASPDPGTSLAPYRIYNIGNNSPVKLLDMISALEQVLGKEAVKNFMPLQPGDVPATYANVDNLVQDVGFKPHTNIVDGVREFVDWYRQFYQVAC